MLKMQSRNVPEDFALIWLSTRATLRRQRRKLAKECIFFCQMNLKNMDQENNEHSLPMDTEHN